MKTSTRTEFAVMGINHDGTTRTLSKRFGNAVDAQKYIGEYIDYTKRFPLDFKAFDQYRIVTRTVTTTWEEWSEV